MKRDQMNVYNIIHVSCRLGKAVLFIVYHLSKLMAALYAIAANHKDIKTLWFEHFILLWYQTIIIITIFSVKAD